MKLRDILAISARMLRSNWLRSLLTVFGFGVAIGTIVVLVGFGYGVQELTIGQIIGQKALLALDVQTGPNNTPPLDADAAVEFKQIPGVQELTPVYVVSGQINYGGKVVDNVLKAGTEHYLDMEGVVVKVGTGYHDGGQEIVLSPKTIELLDQTPEQMLGKQITLKLASPETPAVLTTIDEPFTVVGVTDGNDGGDSSPNYVPASLFTNRETFQPNAYKVLAASRDDLIVAEAEITTKGYQVESSLSTLDDARKVFRWATVGLVFIAAIALLVAAIGMFNTLTITLLERTREIGIMKAIGVTNKAIRELFLMEAVLIGIGGGLAGIGIGVGLSEAINFGINKLAEARGHDALSLFYFPTIFLVEMVLYPAALGLLTGLYPAVRASNINPLKALRYE